MAIQNIDVAKESSVQSAITQASNAYTKANSAATDAAANKTTLATVNTNASTAATKSTAAATDAASAKTNTATNNTASKTGILSQKESYIIGLLENTTYGLNAIKTALGSSSSGVVKSVQRGVLTPSSPSASISISAVTPTKCLVILDNGIAGYGVAASYSDTSTVYGATVTSLESTKLTISTPYRMYDSGCSYSYTYYKVSWQVIEFY